MQFLKSYTDVSTIVTDYLARKKMKEAYLIFLKNECIKLEENK